MLEGIALFLVGVGALLVSIVSLLRMAWLAVLLPLAIAVAAAYAIYALGGRPPRRADRGLRRAQGAAEKSRKIAA